jgi:two-component system KDP operon response regulator KdpE
MTQTHDMTRILVVEDDLPLRSTLAASLGVHGYEVIEAGSAEEGLILARYREPDLVLLDLVLPLADGHAALRDLRTFSDVPVVVLTARDGQRDKVAALDAGADDYVVKPFDDGELMARVRAALRRRPTPSYTEAKVSAGDLVIDLVHNLVTRNLHLVHLTATELRLLTMLVESDGRLLKHRDVAAFLRSADQPDGENTAGGEAMSPQTLRVYIARLRRKLGDDAGEPRLIVTVHGIGYRWIANEHEPDAISR